MIKAIIIDDSRDAINFLKLKLRKKCPDVELVGEAVTYEEGKSLIESCKADILFLDIEIDDKNGFDLLLESNIEDLKVIFTTGHVEYSVKAFKFNAIHYLVKPINDKELVEAVDRVLEIKKTDFSNLSELQNLLNQMRNPIRKKFILSTEKGTQFIDIEKIEFLKSDGSYTEIHLEDSSIFMASKNLKEFELTMPETSFFRISKYYIINLRFVKMLSKQDGGTIIMLNGTEIIVPRRKRQEFLIKMAELA